MFMHIVTKWTYTYQQDLGEPIIICLEVKRPVLCAIIDLHLQVNICDVRTSTFGNMPPKQSPLPEPSVCSVSFFRYRSAKHFPFLP